MVEVGDLKALEFFSTFSGEQLQKIAAFTTRRSYKPNVRVYSQGRPAREIFVVEKGLVSLRAYKSENALEIAFELCERGDLFGAASLLKGQIYTLDAVSLESSDLFVIDAHELSEWCEVDFEFGYRLMKKIAELYLDRYEVAKSELGVPVKARKATG